MSLPTFVGHAQYFVSVALFGLIWTIQLVHYPAFMYIEKERFRAFAKMHTFKITLIVAPLMIAELFSAMYLMVINFFSILQATLLLIVILVWLATIFLSVPYHNTLAKGKNDQVIQRLIKTNWIRTVLWTAKLVLLILFSTLL
jgi:hypothetical protein